VDLAAGEIEVKKMESTLEKHTDVRPIPVCIATAPDGNGEISLIEIWQVLVRRKGIILLSVLASIMLAVAYIMLTEPVYRSKAHLLPPRQADVQGLIIDSNGVNVMAKQYTTDLVYQSFLDTLNSKHLRREFFDAHKLFEHYMGGQTGGNPDQVFDTRFEEGIHVQVDKRNATSVIVTFDDSNAQLAAQRLNELIAFANQRTVQQLSDDVNVMIQAEAEQIRYNVVNKLKLAGERRQDAIIALREALQVATALGIVRPKVSQMAANKSETEIAISMVDVPLYTRGTKALKAEITVLESRKSNERFVPGLRDLQEKLAYLEGLSVGRGELSAVTVDSRVIVPYRAEKPRKALVGMLSALLGIMGGIVLAFVAELLSSTDRERPKE